MDQLEFEQIITVAIKREVEAYEFYRDVSDRVDDISVKNIFDELAREEKHHQELLEKFRQDPTAAIKFEAPPDLKIAESVEEPKLSIDMKPIDAFALAMKKEQQAADFYRGLADICDENEVDLKDTYHNLANIELGHKHRLEKAFINTGYPDSF